MNRFERWAKSEGFNTEKWTHPADGYPYRDNDVNNLWNAWNASKSVQ